MDPSEMEVLQWGNGGGFTGVETTYQLREDGLLSSSSKQGQEMKVLRYVDKKQATQMMSNAKLVGLDVMKYMSPGNTYKFLSFGKGETLNRLSWNDQNERGIPDGLAVMHRNLMHLINNQ